MVGLADMSEASVDRRAHPPAAYRRDSFTWAAFGALLAFGFLNAELGPALPYLRAAEHISYLVAALHQAAFAVGGGVAGLLAMRSQGRRDRGATIRLTLAGAGLAALGVGYGDQVLITVPAALVVSMLATSALIRLWAALSDAHSAQRTVAMTEGEVAVSVGGIITPLLVGVLAATALGWRFAFLFGAVIVLAAVFALGAVRVPPAVPASASRPVTAVPASARRRWPAPTLVVVFAIVALEFALNFWLASYLDDDVGLRRGVAVAAVSGLYAANIAGRLLVSRLARHTTTRRLLVGSIGVGLLGLPILLAAGSAATAAVGIGLAGLGIGATFPLMSSLHVAASSRTADRALGQVLATAAIGQIFGPLTVAVIAQAAGLRAGLLLLPVLALLAVAALARQPASRQ
jgi:MFS family permease